MFQQAILPNRHGARKPLGVLFSFSLQVLVLASLVLIQLLYVPPIPSVQLRTWLTAPPPPISPPRVESSVSEVRQPTSSRRIFVLQAPVSIPRHINTSADVEAPALPDTGIVGTDTTVGGPNDVLSGMGVTPSSPPPRAEPKPPTHSTIQRVGGSVMAANLIRQIQPIYPPLARSARVEGTVEYTAIIDKSGRVANLQLQHGHPLLVKAAQDAILQWRYKPTTLNGEPVDVVTTITVNFKLSN